MKKVILPLCMLLVVCVALSSCATANGSSAASATSAPNPVRSAPSTGTSEITSKQNSQTGSEDLSIGESRKVYTSENEGKRYFEKYALEYCQASLCGHTWDDPSQIDTLSLMQFYRFNEAVDAHPLPTGDDVMIHVPAADLESYIMSYFNVDPKYLETDQRYNTDAKCYDLKYPDGMGMFYPEYVKAEKKNNIIDFYFGNTDYKETMLVHNRLTIELKEDGSFRYIAGEAYEPKIPVSD